jgi:hypothetical protein
MKKYYNGGPLSSLQEELKEVKDELKGIRNDLASVVISKEERIALSNRQVALLTELQSLRADIKSHPDSDKPPGNSITLPQAFPDSSLSFPFSLSPLFVTPSPLLASITLQFII